MSASFCARLMASLGVQLRISANGTIYLSAPARR
jgi:hypothetical protein